jgi:nickel transport protein
MTSSARTVTLALKIAVVFVVMLMFIPSAQEALAHGVELEYHERNAIEVVAHYDTGEPMAEAQVAVFAPGSPAEPWLTGFCDESGRFSFVPDPQLPGLWEVQVRQAGHGGLIRIEVGESGVDAPAVGGYTNAQKVLMIAAVTWGLVGTALFFSRRRT